MKTWGISSRCFMVLELIRIFIYMGSCSFWFVLSCLYFITIGSDLFVIYGLWHGSLPLSYYLSCLLPLLRKKCISNLRSTFISDNYFINFVAHYSRNYFFNSHLVNGSIRYNIQYFVWNCLKFLMFNMVDIRVWCHFNLTFILFFYRSFKDL